RFGRRCFGGMLAFAAFVMIMPIFIGVAIPGMIAVTGMVMVGSASGRLVAVRFLVVMGAVIVMIRLLRRRFGDRRAVLVEEMRVAFVGVVGIGLVGLRGILRRILAGALDDIALDAVAMAAPARVAVARAAAVVGAVLALFLGLAMGALVGLDQRLTVG